MPKEDDRRWQPYRDPTPMGYMHKPLVAYHPYHPHCGVPPGHVYPTWAHPSYPPPGVQMWGHPGFPTWHQPPESWAWKTYPGVITVTAQMFAVKKKFMSIYWWMQLKHTGVASELYVHLCPLC